jgi:uncharacterized protein
MEEIKTGNNKFYIGEDEENPIAEITFVPEGPSKIIVNHTYVSETLRGQGIALKLVNKVTEYAREENKKIIPTCSFVKKVITGSKEYEDVLADI